MDVVSSTFSTVQDVLDNLITIQQQGKGNLIVFVDNECGHPYFFNGNIKEHDDYALFDGTNDANFTKHDHLATVDEMVNALQSVNKDLKCIAECGGAWDDYYSFQHGQANTWIDISDMDDEIFEQYIEQPEYANFTIIWEDDE